jgi:hypothetical protein
MRKSELLSLASNERERERERGKASKRGSVKRIENWRERVEQAVAKSTDHRPTYAIRCENSVRLQATKVKENYGRTKVA